MKYYSFNEYLKNTFGCKVYKLSLNGGMTCPNRDGKIDTRGCIFCSKGGSGEFSQSKNLSITEQIENAKALVKDKIKTNKYIAYFQSFTNTYAPVKYLEKIFTQAINHPDIVALSIGTRPDCLSDEILALLSHLNNIKPVFVELGLQTIHKRTADYIRRGYDLDVYDKAVYNLKNIGINVVTHIILGLPGETKSDMIQTTEYAAKKSNGIKLQLLHILKGTDLAEEYYKGNVNVLSLEEYCDIVCDCLKVIPDDVVIHRITGDGDKKILIAPQWSKNKKRVLNYLNKKIAEI